MGMKEKTSKGISEIQKEARVLKGEEAKDKMYASTKSFDDVDSAAFEFARSRERLFNVNNWSNIPGIANSRFELFDSNGNPLDKSKVETGDFIKIDLPGPLPFYWVKVIEVNEDGQRAQFTVQ